MKQIRAETLLGLTFKVMLAAVFGISACTPNPSQPQPTDNTDTSASVEGLRTPEKPLPATQKNFEDFLKYFRTSETYKHWPESVQVKLWSDPDFVDWEKGELVVDRSMTLIPPGYSAFLPIDPIKSAVENFPVPDPMASYRFYAFEKIEYDQFWLVGIYAYKSPYNEKEYHQHHFFLSTFTKEGGRISDFLWWGDIVGDLEISTDESAVLGDTLVAGYMGNVEIRVYDKVHRKVIVTPSGKFDTVYYSPTVPSTF